MKRWISLLAAIIYICNCVPAHAVQDRSSWYYSEEQVDVSTQFDLYEDFDHYAFGCLGAEGKWIATVKENAYEKIVENAGGKALEIGAEKNSGNVDAHINPTAVGISGSFFITFDIKADSFENGNFFLSLRNAEPNTTNSYDMFQLKDTGEVVYFGGNVDKGGVSTAKYSRLEAGREKNIGLLCNTVEKTVAAYENGEKVAEITDCDLVSQANKTPNFELFYTRFYMSAKDRYAVVLDNIRILELTESDDGLLLNQMLLQHRNANDGENTAELHHVFINDTEKNIEARLLTAAYENDQLIDIETELCEMETGKVRVFRQETNMINSGNMETSKLYVFENDTLRPLTPSVTAADIYYKDGVAVSGESIQNMLQSAGKDGVHPRLIVTEESLEEIKNNLSLAEERNALIIEADKAVDRGNEDIVYQITNGRLLTVSRLVKQRIQLLALSYQMTGEDKYFQAAWDVMERACSFPDWHTAHLLDTAEMCFGIAIGYDWLYDRLSQEQKQIAETALWDKALGYAYDCYISGNGSWMRETVNRNIVNNGSFVIGALALLDKPGYEEPCSEIIRKGLYYIDFMMDSFKPDGAWAEGVGYLEYVLEYFVRTCASLESALGSDFGMTNSQGVSDINRFILFSSGVGGRNNFHDDGSTEACATADMLYLACRLNNPSEAGAYQIRKDHLNKGIQIGDLIWHCEPEKPKQQLLDAYFRGTEFVAMRDSWDDDAQSYLSFHGGVNDDGEGHMHIDAGTFVLDLGGVRWAEDLGTDSITYSYGYGKRKTVYRVRAEGHNTLVINPANSFLQETIGGGQAADTNATVTDFGSFAGGAWAELDLSSAYPDSSSSVTRKYSLVGNRTSAEIYDEIWLKEQTEIYWFMHMRAPSEVVKNSDGSITIGREEKKINISVDYSTEGRDGRLAMDVVAAEKLGSSPPAAEPDDQTPAVEADNGAYRKLQIRIADAPKGVNRIKVRIRLED